MYRSIDEIKQLSIDQSASLRETIKKMNISGKGIIFVVDNVQKLLGTVTDGDFRRTVLSGTSLDTSITEVMNDSPVFIESNNLMNTNVHGLMKENKIRYVPVITNRVINDIIFDSDIQDTSFDFSKEKVKLKIPVVIMAGGKGTRLDPFTRILPKPLIPLGQDPIIKVIMDEFNAYSIQEFYITINEKGKMIKAYFHENEMGYKLNFIEEGKRLGTSGSLKLLQGKFNGPLFITNCDIIIKSDYSDILKFHQERKNDITLIGSMQHYTIPYGVCEIENGGDLINIREKPEYDFITNTGLYILESDVLDLIPDDTYYDMTDLIRKAKESGLKVRVFPVSERSWIDIGQWADYQKAVEGTAVIGDKNI